MARRKKSSSRRRRESDDLHEGRVPTDVSGLDTVLQGGLRVGQLHVITGEPGAGKTVLATELAFRRAARGDPVVIVSFMSEPHSVLMTNLEGFEFFDRSLIADRKLTLLSASRPIAEQGAGGLLDFLRTVVTQSRAKLLVIEGFRALDRMTDNPLASKRLLGELASLGSILGCTIVCTVVRETETQSRLEQIVADGVFLLERNRGAVRRHRTFEIVKLRGGAHLEGVHSFTIEPSGVRIVPRLESLVREYVEPPSDNRRLAFGIPRMDAMLDGGLAVNSCTGLLGAPGAGKTLLGLSFLAEGCSRGEPSLYFGFYENPARLLAKARGIGLKLDAFVQKQVLDFLWQPAIEQPLDLLADRLLVNIRTRRVVRLFIDGLDGFEITSGGGARLMRFLAALTAELRAQEVTTILSKETGLLDLPVHPVPHALSTVYDNIVLLRYVELRGALHRLFSILKMRESDYDSNARKLFISSTGIDVAATSKSAAHVLSRRAGAAEPSPGDGDGKRGRTLRRTGRRT